MPRQARLDVPGALHHVMARGIEKRTIFHDAQDAENLLKRLEKLVGQKFLIVYAWAVLPNHFHLLVRSTQIPLSCAMRSLMTGYAGDFNRRHRRCGHVFQNRFKSILCEEDSYFLELVRYIHLNPLRAGVVKSLAELEAYPGCGHSVVMGRIHRSWQDKEMVLEQFSGGPTEAREAYRHFVADGAGQGRRPDLQGGGLVRSAGGLKNVEVMRRGREKYLSDERVLGSTEFVEQLIRDMEKAETHKNRWDRNWDAASFLVHVCRQMNVDSAALTGGGKNPNVCQARAALAHLWLNRLRRNGRELARELNVKPVTLYSAAKRGQGHREAPRWEKFL